MTKTHEELLREAVELIRQVSVDCTYGAGKRAREKCAKALAALQTANAAPDEEVVEIMARAAWETYRNDTFAPDFYREVNWDGVLELSALPPIEDGKLNPWLRLRDLARAEMRASIQALRPAGYRIVRDV